MDGQGAEAKLVSAGMVDNKAALDQQITLEHRQPRGRSEQTIHNIVANGGKCALNGRTHIHDGASGTDAQLSNKNLGMGDNANINTKPELEIYTDDVSCSHGATVGTLSQEALFYLTSRGIDKAAADTQAVDAKFSTITSEHIQRTAPPAMCDSQDSAASTTGLSNSSPRRMGTSTKRAS